MKIVNIKLRKRILRCYLFLTYENYKSLIRRAGHVIQNDKRQLVQLTLLDKVEGRRSQGR